MAMRAYVAWLVPAMLAWEIAQLPLYTLWRDGAPGAIAFAVLHCSLGDARSASQHSHGRCCWWAR